MDIIDMNSEKSTRSYPHRLLINLSEKKDLKRNTLLYQILAYTIHRNI